MGTVGSGKVMVAQKIRVYASELEALSMTSLFLQIIVPTLLCLVS